MAFDQTTRKRLQKFVTQARDLLSDEFARQLQNDYGMDPDTGSVNDIERLTHLNDAKYQTAALLRDTLAHYQSSSPDSVPKETLARIVREQAFTVLNRLCALRIAEARGILIESISSGYQSKGFQLYGRVAGPSLGDTGSAYKNYLFSVFDEFALDLAVLFDRYSPMGRLFPKESILLGLLDHINDADLEPLWTEDETIGWIYQYFNSAEERRQMRSESQAPRNSRELAVRNQFFTPRYVVEFLTDNTLGRIWYEMTRGKTMLKDQCRYLVRRPNEIFLEKGEDDPVLNDDNADLTQQELLNLPDYINHRPLKDPREILILDPACGSMHFGLYAFDLFETIYQEAWEMQANGQWQGNENNTFELLTNTYPTREALLKDIPRLIIENNIHGIEIDARAVQIAGLSLWLRAQRSWKEPQIPSNHRPEIRKANIVCAEPMPGEKELLKSFIENLKPRVLGQLIEIIFEKMTLAGEAGSLLKIEEEIEETVENAREAFNKELLRRKDEAGYLPGMVPKVRQGELFDFTDLPDKTQFWLRAEEKILESLKNYAEQAEAGEGNRRRLFVEDAAKGFAFIDLCRKRYDVVLMNPPFGAFPKNSNLFLKKHYPDCRGDIYPCFIERARTISRHTGAITNRTGFTLKGLSDWRRNNFIKRKRLALLADLGGEVLDALVETAAYTIDGQVNKFSTSFDLLSEPAATQEISITKKIKLINEGVLSKNVSIFKTHFFDRLPSSPIAYNVTPNILFTFKMLKKIENGKFIFRTTSGHSDDFRFLRLRWEAPMVRIGRSKRWVFYAKGGEYKPYYADLNLVADWNENKRSFKGFLGYKHRPLEKPACVNLFFKGGLTWSGRTASRFSPRVLPKNAIFSSKGPFAGGLKDKDLTIRLGILMSSPFQALLELFVQAGDATSSGSAARDYQVGSLREIPIPLLNSSEKDIICYNVFKILKILQKSDSLNEISSIFKPGSYVFERHSSIRKIDERLSQKKITDIFEILHFSKEIDELVFKSYNFNSDDQKYIENIFGKHPLNHSQKNKAVEIKTIDSFINLKLTDLISKAIENGMTGRFITVKSYYANRHIEILTHILKINPADFKDKFYNNLFIGSHLSQIAKFILSFSLGTLIGRWDIKGFTDKYPFEIPNSPFDPLPSCPPGMLQNEDGLPAEPKDVPANYPLRITWSGIIVDDESHPDDIITRIREAMEVIWKDKANDIEQEACEILGVFALREYFSKSSKFFTDHLKVYSISRRQAPIYWPLSTPSGSYTLWLYYHRLTDQILYTCVNNFVGPKLKEVSEDIASLQKKISRTRKEETELERLSDLAVELSEFQDELLRIAEFWKPDLNDGVQITAAPLWKLFQHKPWQKKLKQTWKELERGKYEWSHLASSIWPERVIRASHKDRSYAIAHDLEDDLWEEIETGTDRQGNVKTKWVPKKLSEKELKAIIEEKIRMRHHVD